MSNSLTKIRLIQKIIIHEEAPKNMKDSKEMDPESQ